MEERDERCRRGKGDIKEGVRVRCALCDGRWHAICVSHVDLSQKSQEDICGHG